MKKTLTALLVSILFIMMVGCEDLPQETIDKIDNYESAISDLEDEVDALKTENQSLRQDITTLQDNYEALTTSNENVLSSISSLQTTISALDVTALEEQVELINDLDLESIQSLLNLDEDVSALNTLVSTIQSSLEAINNYDLDAIDSLQTSYQDLLDDITLINSYDLTAIEDIQNTVETLNTSLEQINTTLSLLQGSDNQTVEELQSEMMDLIHEIDFKLNQLKGYDLYLTGYDLTDEKTAELIFNFETSYIENIPTDDITPVESSAPSDCMTLTYELCYTDSTLPKLYSNQYNTMLNQVEEIKDKEKYINSFGDFIEQFPNQNIPVFTDEVDRYENGEIKYTKRTSETSSYEFTYTAEIDGEEKRIDGQIEIVYDYNDYYKISILFDIKSSTLGLYRTTETFKVSIFNTYNNPSHKVITIDETDYPVNKTILFSNYNNVSSLAYYYYEELKYTNFYRMVYNDNTAVLYADTNAISSEYSSIEKIEYYSASEGMIFEESSYELVPISFYDNWKKMYYREDGELTKIKISKIILDDNSEVVISDEQYSDYYGKIWKKDFIYYNNDDIVELNDYLMVSQRSNSTLTSSITKNQTFTDTINTINTDALNDYYIDLGYLDRTSDIESFTYGETPTNTTKTAQEVYEDALRILEIAEAVYSSSYCYYDSYIDRYMVGDLDADYYDLDSVYVYYPSNDNYKRVYLYANDIGNYQFIGKNPRDYTKDDVTTK